MSGHKRPDVNKRLARIEGHIHGVRDMVNEGKPYQQILLQVRAIRVALEKVERVILEGITEACIEEAGPKAKISLSELKELISIIR